MKRLPCENIIWYGIPVVRRELAFCLINQFGLSQKDAANKLDLLLDSSHKNIGKISDWTNDTIDRYIDIMQGNGEKWARNDNRYRDNVAEGKYQ